MLHIIDDLCEISSERQALLSEVLQWMDKYPVDSLPGPCESPLDDELEQHDEIDQDKLFIDWDVTKNIRRLSTISEEMGLVKRNGKSTDGNKAEEKRKLLEDKMNKQKSRYIATKIFDGMLSTFFILLHFTNFVPNGPQAQDYHNDVS